MRTFIPPHPPPIEVETLGFFESLQFPVLEESHNMILDKPFTVEEVTEAIYSLPPNKAPGLDGLPAEWYKNYAEELSQKLQCRGESFPPPCAIP